MSLQKPRKQELEEEWTIALNAAMTSCSWGLETGFGNYVAFGALCPSAEQFPGIGGEKPNCSVLRTESKLRKTLFPPLKRAQQQLLTFK